jgi:succinyldiaminopimelate transaminase
VGTPVDPTPEPIRAALRAASDAPGYPLTAGSPELRAAASAWVRTRLGAPETTAVLPVIGSKETVSALPHLLDLPGPVRIPELAYPTYRVGAVMAGRPVVDVGDDGRLAGPAPAGSEGGLTWLNSPSNPTGRVLSADRLRADVDAARAAGAVVVSDECYLDFGWEADPVSVLHPQVSGGDLRGVLALHSLSKRSNMAGYRLGLLAGDPALIARLLEVRKHCGLIVPAPVQAAGVAALSDESHVAAQRERYAARRHELRAALVGAGFRVDHSEAGLYLWCTAGEGCWDTVDRLAAAGILVTPGAFYGPRGARHVRVALTATDERVAAACARLAAE